MYNQSKSKLERLELARDILKQVSKNTSPANGSNSIDHKLKDEASSEEYAKARSLAIKYIGISRSMSSGKVYNKLIDSEVDAYLADTVVAGLIEDGYIDDLKACAKIARRHSGSRAKSKYYLRQLFAEQGVAHGTGEHFLETWPSDRDTIRDLLPRELPSEPKEKARLYRKLMSRGYNMELIRSVCEV